MPTMPATELRLDAVLDWMRHLIAERDRLAAEVAALKAAAPAAVVLPEITDEIAAAARRAFNRVTSTTFAQATEDYREDWRRVVRVVRDLLFAPLLPEPADPDAAAVEAMADAIREAGHAAPPRTPLDSKLLARAALAAYRKLIDGEAH